MAFVGGGGGGGGVQRSNNHRFNSSHLTLATLQPVLLQYINTFSVIPSLHLRLRILAFLTRARAILAPRTFAVFVLNLYRIIVVCKRLINYWLGTGGTVGSVNNARIYK